jgi:uroporphyrinogen decarboxylase
MTPRERVISAMNLRKPDRVPSMSQFSFGFMNQQLKDSGITPMEFWLDAKKYAQGLIILRDRFDFDGILVSVHGHFSNWRERILKLEYIAGLEVATYENRTETYVDDDLPVGKFFEQTERDIYSVDPGEIPLELDYIASTDNCYVFIDQEEPYRVFHVLEEELKGRFSIHAEVSSPLDYLMDYLGYQNALMAMIMEPEKVKQILERYTVGVVKMASDLGKHNDIDAIKISSPFAGGGFISPEDYLTFELPYLRQVSNSIKENGKFAYVHTCGSINDRLEAMAEAGLSGLECLDPPPLGNVELGDAFSRIGGKMFIKGNIDSVNTLLEGSEEQITEDVKQRIACGMKNQGFILSTACSIAPKVPEENVQMLSRLVKKFGQYK